MATTIVNTTLAAADETKTVARRTAVKCRALMQTDAAGIQTHKFGGFVKHNDLQGTWKKALADAAKGEGKTYVGLVPIIDTVKRFDLALLEFDLLTEQLATYVDPNKKDITYVDPTDRLHTFVRQQLDANPNLSIGQLCDLCVASFPAGTQFGCFEYNAVKKDGGSWPNCIFGLK